MKKPQLPLLPKHFALFNRDGPDGYRIKGYTAEQMQEYALAALAAAAPVAAPDDWKLVPIEPTEAMMRAMTDGFIPSNRDGDSYRAFAQGYQDMLASAPVAAQPDDAKDAPDVWVVSNQDGPDYVAADRGMANDHANDMAEQFPELGPVNVRRYVAAPNP